MRIIFILLCCSACLAQDLRHVYGTGSSAGGQSADSLFRIQSVAGQFVEGVAAGDNFATSTSLGFVLMVSNDVSSGASSLPALPQEFSFQQNFPNPFNLSTTFRFSLPNEARVQAHIYNIKGQRVAILADGVYAPGSHKVLYEPSARLSTGIYFVSFAAGDFRSVRKFVLMK